MLRLGIIGCPLKHSLSPLLHTLLMQSMGLDGEYRPYELEPNALRQGLEDLGNAGVRGLNVTIPHKVAVIPLLDRISPEAELTGAVNTIVLQNFGRDKLGYNTDIAGFARSLPESITQRLPEGNVLLMGSGGGARAVANALLEMGVASLTVAVRNPEKAVAFTSQIELMKQHYDSDAAVHIVSLYSLPSLESFAGIVNTTPVGMWPDGDQSLITPIQLETLPVSGFVYDLVYRPLETRLLQDARSLGRPALDGLDMLIHQGIASFELWQDRPVPEDLIPGLRHQLEGAVSKVPT